MKYDKKIIGSRIKKACRDRKAEVGKKLTQEKLAEIIHYDRVTVNSWANGRDLVPFDILLRMCDSDIFNCELGYLLGEHEGKTRAATDIVKETSLTEEAVEILQKYKNSASNRESYPASKFLYPDEFIPALISYMLTSDDFKRLVDRICSQNRKTLDYAFMKKKKKEIITEAYKSAKELVGAKSVTDVTLLRDWYTGAIKSIIARKKDAISDHIKASVTDRVKRHMGADADRYLAEQTDEFYEYVFTEGMKNAFDLLRLEESEVIEMNNFLNQKELFDILKGYNKPIALFRKEV